MSRCPRVASTHATTGDGVWHYLLMRSDLPGNRYNDTYSPLNLSRIHVLPFVLHRSIIYLRNSTEKCFHNRKKSPIKHIYAYIHVSFKNCNKLEIRTNCCNLVQTWYSAWKHNIRDIASSCICNDEANPVPAVAVI